MSSTRLHRWQGKAESDLKALVTALAQLPAQPGQSLGLLYSPRSCELALLDGGRPLGPEGPFSLEQVFEARWFCDLWEARWHHEAGGRGSSVLISEEPLEAGASWRRTGEPEVVEGAEQRYLLWGACAGLAPAGWSRLTEGRVADLLVPLGDLEPGDRVQLRAMEYFRPVGPHGVVCAIEERLLGLEKAPVEEGV